MEFSKFGAPLLSELHCSEWGIRLTKEQQKRIFYWICSSSILVIYGRPKTGKTSLCDAISNCFDLKSREIKIMNRETNLNNYLGRFPFFYLDNISSIPIKQEEALVSHLNQLEVNIKENDMYAFAMGKIAINGENPLFSSKLSEHCIFVEL